MGHELKMMSKVSNIVDVYVGARLRMRRTMLGMSQSRLGELLGVTFQQIQKYEVGVNRIGTGRLVRIAAILGVPIAALFDGVERADHASSLLSLVADSRSFRLAHAFAAIENSALRLSLVNLVEKVAAAVPQSKRPRT